MTEFLWPGGKVPANSNTGFSPDQFSTGTGKPLKLFPDATSSHRHRCESDCEADWCAGSSSKLPDDRHIPHSV